jgi:membrane protein implicated in regulation of membrane protease activity
MDWAHHIELFKERKPARVEHPITHYQRGRVFFEGTYWPAKIYASGSLGLDDALAVSSWVTVIGRQGLTLLVKPD